MTQNYTSSALPSDKRDETPPSSEIRADIDQTRASVGEKIDQLQARLDPNKLKVQAQETVQEMLSDTANQMTEYVRTHKDEMVNSLATAARRNPLPTALVGLGVGWLLLESMGGDKRRDDDWEAERRYRRMRQERSPYEGGRFEGSTGRSFVSQGRGQFMEEDYYSPNYTSPDYGRSGYPTSSGYEGQSYQGQPEYQGQGRYGNGHQRGENPLAKAADAVKNTVGDVTSEIKDRVGDATSEIKDRVSDATSEIKDRVSGAGQGVQERVDSMTHGVQDRMGNTVDDMRYQRERLADRGQQMGERMMDRGQRTLNRAGYQMEEWQARARYEGQRRGQQVVRNLEDNPLTYGALALAAGAALALLLPQTRTENRYFGEVRDEIMERGQEVMETAKSRAQQVAQEIRPELEEKARQIVSDAKEIGKEVAKDAVNELRPVVDKAVTRGKEEAVNAAQEAGIDPSKLTGKSGNVPALNRDTLAGQWKQVKGDVKSKWGQLTDDELTRVEGDYEKLVGAIQTRYGYTRERVEREVNDWFNSRKG